MTDPSNAIGATSTRMISVDDHVVEPPDVWTSRLPAKWHDECPRAVEEDGKIVWRFENKQKSLAELGGRLFDPRVRQARPDRLPRALRGPPARVLPTRGAGRATSTSPASSASLCFPSFPRFCGQEFTEAPTASSVSRACVRTTTG